MWRKIFNYQALAHSIHSMKVQSGNQTTLWFGKWNPLGIHDLTGNRGCVDIGIQLKAIVASICHPSCRRQRHISETCALIEQVIEVQKKLFNGRRRYSSLEQSIDVYKEGFNSKTTWNMFRSSSPRVTWRLVLKIGRLPDYSTD